MSNALAKPQLTAALFGASGAVGQQILRSLLASDRISSVHSFGRSAPATTSPKLSSTSIDFTALLAPTTSQVEAAKIQAASADIVFVALGTTRAAAGSSEEFVRVDKEFVLAAAKAAKVEGKSQKVLYCSSAGASASSYFLYPQSKGLTEVELAKLGYEDTIIFRPAMLNVPGGRKEHRLVESVAAKFTSMLSNVSSAIQIETPVLGDAFVAAGVEGSVSLEVRGFGKFESLHGKGVKAFVITNAQAQKLAAKPLV